MQRRRRLVVAGAGISVSLALLAAGALVPAGPAGATGPGARPMRHAHAKHTVHIAMFGYNTTPYSLASLDATKKAAKKYGATVTFFNANSSATTQATQMRDAIQTHKYQAFWLWAQDALAMQPVVRQAAKAGIKVATADATLGNTKQSEVIQAVPGVTVALGVGLRQEAKVGVATIEAACRAQVGAHHACHVALMPGFDSFPPDVYRLGYIEKALKKTKDITATTMPQGQYSTPGAQKSTLDFFQTQPKVDVIYTFADQMIGGVLVALKQLHLTPGKSLQLVGFGATTEAEKGIEKGTWFASQGLYPATESRFAVKYLVEAVEGKKVPRVVNLYKLPGGLAVIDKAVLAKHKSFKPNWSYAS